MVFKVSECGLIHELKFMKLKIQWKLKFMKIASSFTLQLTFKKLLLVEF